ncbi:MAG: pentapeptide repeat-containing protein [Candidatus Lambdaproteobacteria bacterium]|nr:pentapeptide repeat-containing protein [Candidatus Lambdaproteobacteria bacterium]
MQLTKEIFDKLKENVAFLKNFNDGELLGVLKSTQREMFQDGEIIFKEGTRGDKMYIIITGSVRIGRPIGKQQEEVLAQLEHGSLFGEMGPIDQSPRSARATAVGPTVLLSLREAILRQQNIALAYKLYKNFSVMLAERLRATNQRLADLSVSDRGSSEKIKDLVKKRIERGEGIQGVNLRNANLTEVFLHNADLKDSVMVGANLTNAKMSKANLHGCKMVSANFSGADLSGADLSGSDFTGAVFTNANLNGASLNGANFAGADLSESILEGLAAPKGGAAAPKAAQKESA